MLHVPSDRTSAALRVSAGLPASCTNLRYMLHALATPQVRSICEEMTMDGCERCMPSWQAGKKWADCDLLDTYSYLCYQMPGGWRSGSCSCMQFSAAAEPHKL